METYDQAPIISSKTPATVDPEESYDPLYRRAFYFAKEHGYGFVQFVNESADDRPIRRRPSSLYKANIFIPQEEDRLNPVHVRKSASRPFGFPRNKCTEKPRWKEDEELDTMQIIRSVKKDIALVKKISSDFEKFSAEGLDSSRSVKRSKSRNKRRLRRHLKRDSPSKSPVNVTERQAEDVTEKDATVDAEDNIILSAPLQEYMAYLSRRCSKVCGQMDLEIPISLTTGLDEDTKAIGQGKSADTDIARPAKSAGEASSDTPKTPELRTTTNQPDYNQFLAQDKSPHRVRKFPRKSHTPLNMSRNNTPTMSSLLVSEDRQEVLSSPEDKEFEKCRKDRSAQQYKLCSSLSSTIFRETQLAQKHQKDVSTKLPVVRIDLICMTNEREDDTDSALSSIRTTRRHFHHKFKGLDLTAETKAVARRRCFRKGRPGWYLPQYTRTDSRDLSGYKVDGGSCPNLAIADIITSGTPPWRSEARSPTSSCRSTLSSTVGDSPTKSEVICPSTRDIPSSARGDEGHTAEIMDKTGKDIQSMEKAAGSSPRYESTNSRAKMDSSVYMSSDDDERVACHSSCPCDLPNTERDDSSPVFSPGPYLQYSSVRKPVLIGGKDTLAAIMACDESIYRCAMDDTDVHKERTCSLSLDLEARASVETNTNNNALPQMPESNDNYTDSSTNRPEIANEVFFHLPVLAGNRMTSPTSESRNNSHSLDSSKSNSIPPVISTPVCGKGGPTRGSKTQGVENKMDHSKVLELPTISDHTGVAADRGNPASRVSKKSLIHLTPVSSVIAEQSDSHGRHGQKHSSGSEIRKVHPLNKSYVISRSDMASDMTEKHKDCWSLLPALTNTTGLSRMPDEQLRDILTPKASLLEASKLPAPQQSFQKTDRVPTKGENVIMPLLSTNNSQNFNFIPKPTASTRSPQFATTTRPGKEDTRRTIGNDPEGCGKDPVSHHHSDNFNNSCLDSDPGAASAVGGCPRVDSFDYRDQNLTEHSRSAMRRRVSLRKFSASAELNEENSSPLQGAAGLNDRNTNNCRNKTVRVHKGNSDSTCSLASVGLQLERELSALMAYRSRTSRSLAQFPFCSHCSASGARCVQHLDSLPDVNTSNPRRRQGREQEHARRRSINLSRADHVNDEEAGTLENQTTGQLRCVRFRQPSVEPPPQDAECTRSSHGHVQPQHHGQSRGSVSVDATTENYWQTAAIGPLPTLGQYYSKNEEGTIPFRNGKAQIPFLQHSYTAHNVSQLYSPNIAEPIVDDPMDKISDSGGSIDSDTGSSWELVTHQADLSELYTRLDEMVMHSQHELSHQLDFINQSVNTRLKSLQDLVEKRFQRTCSLIQNNSPRSEREQANWAAEKTTPFADNIQLNTTKAPQAAPAFAFPLDVPKATKLSEKLSPRSGTAATEDDRKEAGVPKVGVQTFPTIQFVEVTQKSSESLPAKWHNQNSALDSSQTLRQEESTATSSKQRARCCKEAACKSRALYGSNRRPIGRERADSEKKAKKRSYTTRTREDSVESPRYKSMRQWREEINKPLFYMTRDQSRNGNSRYTRIRHSRCCRRRQAVEGTFCNRCLPVVCPVRGATLRARCRRFSVRKGSRKARVVSGILRDSRGRRARRTSRGKTVRFRIESQRGRKAKRRKLRSPPPDFSRRSKRSQSKKCSGPYNRCSHNHALISMWRASRRKGNVPETYVARLSRPRKPPKHKRVQKKGRPGRRAGETRFVIGPNGHKSLYKLYRRRFEILKRRLSQFRCNRRVVNSQVSSNDRIERLVKQFRFLITGFPERRLRTLQEILDPIGGRVHNNRADGLNVTMASPVKLQLAPDHVLRQRKTALHGPLQTRPEFSYSQDDSESINELSVPTTSQGCAYRHHHQTLPFDVDHLHFRNHTNNEMNPAGNASRPGLSHQLPGYSFFNTASRAIQPTPEENVARHGDTSSDTNRREFSHPRPVDSLDLIRRQLHQSKNISRNAACLGRSYMAGNHRADRADGDGSTILFTDRALSCHTDYLMPIEETIEGENSNLPSLTLSDSDEQLGVIAFPQIILVKDDSFSSVDSDNEDSNSRGRHGHQSGLLSEPGLSQSAQLSEPGLSQSAQSLNTAYSRGEGHERSHHSPRESPMQNLAFDSQAVGFNRCTRKVTLLSAAVDSNEETVDSKADRCSDHSGHTGMFNIHRVSGEDNELSMHDKQPGVFDNPHNQRADKSVSTNKDVINRERDKDENSATVWGSSQTRGGVKTQNMKVNSTPVHERAIPGKTEQPFKSRLWEGFKPCQTSGYKASVLLSFLTDQYRTPPKAVSSSSTCCSTRHSQPNLSGVDVRVNERNDEVKDNQGGELPFISPGSEHSRCSCLAVATSENNSPSMFGAETEQFDSTEKDCLQLSHRRHGVTGQLAEGTDTVTSQRDDSAVQGSSQLCQASSQSQPILDRIPKRPCPTLVLRYRLRHEFAPPQNASHKKDNTISTLCAHAHAYHPSSLHIPCGSDQTDGSLIATHAEKEMGTDLKAQDTTCHTSKTNDQTQTLHGLPSQDCVHDEMDQVQSPFSTTANHAQEHRSKASVLVQSVVPKPLDTPSFQSNTKKCQTLTIRAETQSQYLVDEGRSFDTRHTSALKQDGAISQISGSVNDQRNEENKMVNSENMSDEDMEISPDCPEYVKTAALPSPCRSVERLATSETAIEHPSRTLDPALTGNESEELFKQPEQGVSSTKSAEGHRKPTQTTSAVPCTESDIVGRLTFQQPYFVVNSPGISTTWVCFVPEFSSPGVVNRNNVITSQDTDSTIHEDLNYPHAAGAARQRSVGDRKYVFENNCNQSNATGMNDTRVEFWSDRKIYSQTLRETIRLPQQGRFCPFVTADTFKGNVEVDPETNHSLTPNGETPGMFAALDCSDGAIDGITTVLETCSADVTVASESHVKNWHAGSSSRGDGLSGLQYRTESAITSLRDLVSDEQITVFRKGISNIRVVARVYNGKRSSRTVSMAEASPAVVVTGLGHSAWQHHCGPSLPSSPASGERNNNAIRQNDTTVRKAVGRLTHAQNELLRTGHTSWSVYEADDGQQNVRSKKTVETEEPFDATPMTCIEWGHIRSSLSQQHHAEFIEGPICGQDSGSAFMASSTRSLTPAGQKRRAGKSLFQQMSPPRKILKMSSHSTLCRHFISTRRERITVRRARRQLARELTYLRHRQQGRERINVTDFKNGQQSLTSHLSGSDADSESSL